MLRSLGEELFGTESMAVGVIFGGYQSNLSGQIITTSLRPDWNSG
jgi:hypothetical protein